MLDTTSSSFVCSLGSLLFCLSTCHEKVHLTVSLLPTQDVHPATAHTRTRGPSCHSAYEQRRQPREITKRPTRSSYAVTQNVHPATARVSLAGATLLDPLPQVRAASMRLSGHLAALDPGTFAVEYLDQVNKIDSPHYT